MHTLLQKSLSNPEKESHSSQGLGVSNEEKCLHCKGLRRAHWSNRANPQGLSQRAVCPSACSPLPRSALGSSRYAVSVQTPSHLWLRAPHPDLQLCPSEPSQRRDPSFHPCGAQILSTVLVFPVCKPSTATDHRPCQPPTWCFQGCLRAQGQGTLFRQPEEQKSLSCL